jgi:hypothetical protein
MKSAVAAILSAACILVSLADPKAAPATFDHRRLESACGEGSSASTFK